MRAKIFRSFFILMVSAYMVTSFSSCCSNQDCLDEVAGAIEIKLHFDDRPDKKFRSQFFSSKPDSLAMLDSVFVIKTVKGDTGNQLDTIYHFEKDFFNRTNIFFVPADFEFDWIYQNNDPFFKHTITDMSSKTERTSTFCKCQKMKSASFKFDGKELNEKDIPFFFDKLD